MTLILFERYRPIVEMRQHVNQTVQFPLDIDQQSS